MAQTFGIPVWILVPLFLGVSIFLASVRSDAVEVIGEAVNFFADPLDRAADWLMGPQQGPRDPIPGLERALLYAVLSLLVGLPDVLMMADRVATLLGVEETPLPSGVGILMGVAVTFGEIIYTLAYFDLAATKPQAPWDELPEHVLEFLKRHVLQLAIGLAVTTAGAWLWGALAVTGIYFDGLGWLITLLLGLQLAGAAALAFAVGRRAYAVVLIGILAVLGGGLKLLVALLDGVAATLTKFVDVVEVSGRRTWNWFADSGIGRWLNLKPIPARQPRPRIGRKQDDPNQPLNGMEDDVMKPKPRYSLLAQGKLGTDVALEVSTADVVWGALDKDRPMAGQAIPPAVLRTSTNVSPTGPALARGQAVAIEAMFSSSGDVHVEKQVTHGVTTIIFDDYTVLDRPLLKHSKRFPDERLVLVSDLAEHNRSPHGQNGGFHFHYELNSPLISRLSYERFVSTEASVINSLQVAPEQYAQNFTYGQVVQLLDRPGVCYGLRSHSELCAPGKLVPFFGRALKRANGFTPAYGDPRDVLNRARTACELALSDDAAAAVHAPVDLAEPFAAVFRMPLAPRHRDFASIVRELDSWLRQAYPQAVGVYASGNGVAPAAAMEKERWVQCAILFPLPHRPAESAQPKTTRQKRQTAS
jgi:hypothetical protein